MYSLRNFLIVMSGRFASTFLSVLIVKFHRIVTSVLSITGCDIFSCYFPVWVRLKFYPVYETSDSVMSLEILSINNCRACSYYMICCFLSLSLSLSVHSLQLGSVRIFDWYALVDILWS